MSDREEPRMADVLELARSASKSQAGTQYGLLADTVVVLHADHERLRARLRAVNERHRARVRELEDELAAAKREGVEEAISRRARPTAYVPYRPYTIRGTANVYCRPYIPGEDLYNSPLPEDHHGNITADPRVTVPVDLDGQTPAEGGMVYYHPEDPLTHLYMTASDFDKLRPV